MRGFLEVTGLGNVGRDAELKYASNGDAVASFSVASTESFKDKQGQKQDRTTWMNCTAFGKLGEICGEYVKKGAPLFFKGDLRQDDWEDKDGNKKTSMKVILKEIRLLSDGKGRPEQQAQTSRPAPQRESPPADPGEAPF